MEGGEEGGREGRDRQTDRQTDEICTLSLPPAIAIKESVHVGDKTQKRLARGVDELGMRCTCTCTCTCR